MICARSNWTWWLAALYGAWYLVLALLLPLPWILNGLLDDSFYYLQVARNVARGLGSSFDGTTATNGYHPLWMLLMVPVHWVSGEHPERILRIALSISALLGLGSLLLVRRLLLRDAGPWAALTGMLLFAWPRFFGQTMNLLETGLLLFLYLCVIAVLVRPGPGSGGRRTALGFLLGLASLARLDTIFLLLAAGILGLAEALRGRGFPWVSASSAGGSARRRLWWNNTWFLGVAAALLAPYLLWNLRRFGHLQPVSGAVKSTFPRMHLHAEYLYQFPEFTLLLLFGAVFFIASLRREAGPPADPPPAARPGGAAGFRWIRALGLFGLAALLHMAYTLLFMGWGVDRWHFGLLIPIGLLGIPWSCDRLIASTGRDAGVPTGRRGGPGWLRLPLLAGGLAAAVTAQAISMHARQGRHLPAVRECALWARDNLAPDAVFGMTDAGVFAYFSGRTTVNLDGLINNFEYQEALRQGRVLDYLRARRIGYIFDQWAYGRPDWLSGRYESRPMRFWYHPENRVAGEIALYRADEVHRVNLLSRRSAGRLPEPNALLLYRYRPEAQSDSSRPVERSQSQTIWSRVPARTARRPT